MYESWSSASNTTQQCISFCLQKSYSSLTMEPDPSIISSLGIHTSHDRCRLPSLSLLLHARSEHMRFGRRNGRGHRGE